MSFYKTLLVIGIISTTFACTNKSMDSKKIEPPQLLDDLQIREHLIKKSADTYEKGNTVALTDLQAQLNRRQCSIELPTANETGWKSGDDFYKHHKKGVLIVGKLFKCSKCPNYHINPASAFVISKDGYCVTNYHVFDPKQDGPYDHKGVFVMDYKKRVYAVTEILAASEADDLVIFKIEPKSNTLEPLVLGQLPAIGSAINLISHPSYNFYNYTKGYITRYYKERGTQNQKISISADFAKGSSGAPLLNDDGSVVGVVAASYGIYYTPEQQVDLQMIIKECIPVNRLHKLIKK